MKRLGRSATWLLMLAAPAAALASGASGCKVIHNNATSSSAAGTGGSGGGSTADSSSSSAGTGGTPADTGRSIFESTVLPGMLTECGSCHQLGGISDVPFLALPDQYVSITTWPGIIVSNPQLSIILTHPSDPSHGGGQAPDMSQALRAKVTPWLNYEAAHLPMADAGTIYAVVPFKPFLMGAFNAVYLDSLGPDFANASLTFNAEQLNTPPTLLHLSNIQVHPVAGVDLHLVHPLFTVYPSEGGELPDPSDSFSGFDQTFDIAGDPTFGTGELILSQWEKDARLGIGFQIAEVIKMGGTTATCKDVAKFQSEVAPQLQAMLSPCATMCHGGGKIEAQQQMDLSNLGAMPPDDACAQVRARIQPGNPAMSQILIVTDPAQGATHDFKFLGSETNYNNFKTAVSPWILAEQ